MKLYSSATNSRGKVIGTGGGAKSQTVHTRTWSVGVKVISEVMKNGKVQFHIYETAGSTGDASDKLITTITEE